MKKLFALLFLSLFLVSFVSAFSFQDVLDGLGLGTIFNPECSSNADCPYGQVCGFTTTGKKCFVDNSDQWPYCSYNSECSSGNTCQGGYCLPPVVKGGVGDPCFNDAVCGSGLICSQQVHKRYNRF